MHKKIFTVLFLLLSGSSLFSQDDVSQAKWQAKPIVIDGHDDEWDPPFNLFDNKTGMIFSVTNDQQNLYLCFTENEELKAEKLMKAGWSLELSSSEKKKKFAVSINFPKVEDPNINLRSDYKNQVSYYKMDLAVIRAKGFLQNNGDLPLQTKDGLNIGIGSENDQKLIYEIAIPLKELVKENKLSLNEQFTLDITVNALNRPNSGSGQSTGAGFSGGGRRMGGGAGRMGGGGRGAGRGSFSRTGNVDAGRMAIFDKAGFKQKFSFAAKA
jgi:hypothetical protein